MLQVLALASLGLVAVVTLDLWLWRSLLAAEQRQGEATTMRFLVSGGRTASDGSCRLDRSSNHGRVLGLTGLRLPPIPSGVDLLASGRAMWVAL